MRKIELKKGNLNLTDETIGFYEKTVNKFGAGAKVDCPKQYLNHKAYLIITKRKEKAV
jgi:putative transposon-encoded protein